VEKALTDKLMNKIAFTIALDGKSGITNSGRLP